ncbi:hypothetical protein [Ferruginibacter sp.]
MTFQIIKTKVIDSTSRRVGRQFSENVEKLYNLAAIKTTGANFVYYLTDRLQTQIKKSTINDSYRNVVIILTDGYLELSMPNKQKRSISPEALDLNRFCTDGNAAIFTYPTNTLGLTYKNCEIYLLEFNEKKSGEGCHFKALQQWWTNWIKTMEFSNVNNGFIFRKRAATDLTKKDVQGIFGL